jgi:type IV secretion system protein TrbL
LRRARDPGLARCRDLGEGADDGLPRGLGAGPAPVLRRARVMTDTGVIDRFFDTFTHLHRQRVWPAGRGGGVPLDDPGGHRRHLGGAVLGLVPRRGRLGPAGQEDPLCRVLRLPDRQLPRPDPDRAQELFRPGPEGSGAGISADDFLRPGKLAALGISACKPILQAASELGGFPGFFENIVQIVILLVVALFMIVAFFIIAVQVFVVLIEFKLTTLAGFVLVPFGLFGRTAFLAERVLGNVIASGVKVMVLAVIVGIGSSLFDEFNAASSGQPTLEEVLAMALAALTLLGLSIFGPGVASGLVSGAPQLGAGAAVGTGLMVGGMAMAGAGAAQMAVGGMAGLQTGMAGAAAGGGGPPPTGGAGPGPEGAPGGPSPGSPSGGGAAASSGQGPSIRPPGSSGGGSEGDGGGGGEGGGSAPPAWARDLQHKQALAHGVTMAVHAAGSGDDHSGGASPSLSENS